MDEVKGWNVGIEMSLWLTCAAAFPLCILCLNFSMPERAYVCWFIAWFISNVMMDPISLSDKKCADIAEIDV